MRRFSKVVLVAICGALLLSGCSPKLVGEAKAKEAGLALINLAFDADVTDAVVTYEAYACESGEKDGEGQSETSSFLRAYTVTVEDPDSGEALYTAGVDAKTGLAYYAYMSGDRLSALTDEQLQESKELSGLTWGGDEITDVLNESLPQATVFDWAQARFERQSQLSAVLDTGMEADWSGTNRIYMGYLAVFANGAVYDIGISWPTMEIYRVTILSQPVMS